MPYPAWYFLSLFGLLALVPPEIHLGPLSIGTELIATIVVPTLFLVVVLLLPWLDRSKTRSLAARGGVLWTTTIVVGVIIGLSIFGQLETMAKQASAPASPPESVVLGESGGAEASGGTSGTASVAGAGGQTNANGAKVFSANCSSCHGATGQGTPGAFPPLANNPVVTGNAKTVIGIVLNGLHSRITVNGQSFNGQMPAWKGNLSNGDIADVITYIRGGLGNNHASAVTTGQVTAYRK